RKTDDPLKWDLAELGEKWMHDHVETLGAATMDYYRIALDKRVAPYLYDRKIGSIRRRDVIAWRAEMMRVLDKDGKRVHSPRNINAAMSTLKAMYGWLLTNWDDEVSIANPVSRIKMLDEHTKAIRVYEPGEVMNLADQHYFLRQQQAEPKRGSMPRRKAHRLQSRDVTMTLVLGFCGLRMGELVGLELQHYDDGRVRDKDGKVLRENTVGWLTVEQQLDAKTGKLGATKGKRTRQVPILDSLRRALDWYIASMPDRPLDAPLFPSMNRTAPAHWGYLPQGKWGGSTFKRAAIAAGFPNAVPHELRHTFASMMIERTRGRITPGRLAKWMGHKDATTTLRIYAHLYDRNEDDLLRDVDADVFLSPTSLPLEIVEPDGDSDAADLSLAEPGAAP
ncbi:MAG: site-specific integrase, partial [Thermoleophilia bacterium]|nr:site-specific integrase [Thermoleophilia bacterium]